MRELVALCLVGISSLPCLAAVQFAPRQDISTGLQHLSGLVSADFNGDGRPDIAVTSSLDKQVLVYLNKGDGTFSAPVATSVQISNTTGAIVAGDFNEDGKQDLIVATIAGPQVNLLLLGNGDGTFTQAAALPGSFGFFDAAVVDINHDSHLDLIAAGNGTLYVYLGDGHGNFALQPFSNQGSGGAFFGIAAGDFNNDQKIDFVTAPFNFGQNSGIPTPFRLFSGNSDGSFQGPSFLTNSDLLSPQYFAAADFNGDGKLDILVSEPDVALVILGNGDGTFQLDRSQISGIPTTQPPPGVFGNSSPLLAVGDADADGSLDVVTADNLSNVIDVVTNDGAANFTLSFSAPLDNGSATLKLADLNGDGLPDLIVTNYITQKISVFLSIRPPINPKITLSTASAQALTGTSLTFSVAVSGLPAKAATGTATLLDNATTLAQAPLDANGKATFTVNTLAVGQHPLSVTYSGDQSYKPGASNVVNEAITDFQPALPTPSQTVTAGAAATFTLAITPTPGLTGTANLSCSGLPSGYSCPPVSVPLNGQPINATLSVTTPARTIAAVDETSKRLAYAASLSLSSLLFAPLLLRRRSKISSLFAAFFLFTVGIFAITGCSGSSATPPAAPVTTPFSIVTSVTQGGQTVTHSVSATITVN